VIRPTFLLLAQIFYGEARAMKALYGHLFFFGWWLGWVGLDGREENDEEKRK